MSEERKQTHKKRKRKYNQKEEETGQPVDFERVFKNQQIKIPT